MPDLKERNDNMPNDEIFSPSRVDKTTQESIHMPDLKDCNANTPNQETIFVSRVDTGTTTQSHFPIETETDAHTGKEEQTEQDHLKTQETHFEEQQETEDSDQSGSNHLIYAHYNRSKQRQPPAMHANANHLIATHYNRSKQEQTQEAPTNGEQHLIATHYNRSKQATPVDEANHQVSPDMNPQPDNPKIKISSDIKNNATDTENKNTSQKEITQTSRQRNSSQEQMEYHPKTPSIIPKDFPRTNAEKAFTECLEPSVSARTSTQDTTHEHAQSHTDDDSPLLLTDKSPSTWCTTITPSSWCTDTNTTTEDEFLNEYNSDRNIRSYNNTKRILGHNIVKHNAATQLEITQERNDHQEELQRHTSEDQRPSATQQEALFNEYSDTTHLEITSNMSLQEEETHRTPEEHVTSRVDENDTSSNQETNTVLRRSPRKHTRVTHANDQSPRHQNTTDVCKNAKGSKRKPKNKKQHPGNPDPFDKNKNDTDQTNEDRNKNKTPQETPDTTTIIQSDATMNDHNDQQELTETPQQPASAILEPIKEQQGQIPQQALTGTPPYPPSGTPEQPSSGELGQINDEQQGHNPRQPELTATPQEPKGDELKPINGKTENDTQPELTMTQVYIQDKIIKDGMISIKTLNDATSLDPTFDKIIKSLKDGTASATTPYSIVNTVLCRKASTGDIKICLPRSLHHQIFFTEHFGNLGQHRSAYQIATTIGRHFYTPNMLQEFKLLGKHCYYCRISKPNQEPKHTLQSTLTTTKPREVWHFDIAQGLKKTTKGHTCIHMYICQFSLYSIMVPAIGKSGEEIIRTFKDNIIKPFTIPAALRSDREAGVLSAEFKTFTDPLGIILLPTAPGSSYSNATAEGRIKIMKGIIRSVSEAQDDTEWDDNLHLTQIALNKTIGKLGYSAESIMFGHQLNKPNDILNVTDNFPEENYVETVQQKLKTINEEITKRREEARIQNNETKNQHRKAKQFEIDQLVYIRHDIITSESGMKAKFRGPYIVKEISQHGSTATVQHINGTNERKVHFSQMTKADSMNMPTMLNSNWRTRLKTDIFTDTV